MGKTGQNREGGGSQEYGFDRAIPEMPVRAPQSKDIQEAAGHIHLQLEEEILCAHLGIMRTQVGCEAMD